MNQKIKANAKDDLNAQLDYLRLPFIRQNFEDLARQAITVQWSHLDFLSRLIQGETGTRYDRSTQRRIQNARFPVLKTLEQFNFTFPEKISRPQIQDLFRLNFI